jgi:hypothetical protein
VDGLIEDIGRGKNSYIGKKNVSAASYIAAFVNSTKETAMDWSDKAEVYRGRKPRESPLWQLFDHHFDEFEYRYDDLFSREYGLFRPVISHIVRKYLECGDLDQGFALGTLPRLSP